MIRQLLLRGLCALGMLLSVALAGCESLNFPWSATNGVPAQWEPDVEASTPRGS
jgi:hypothetical protein